MIQSIFNDTMNIRQKPNAPPEHSNAVEQSSPETSAVSLPSYSLSVAHSSDCQIPEGFAWPLRAASANSADPWFLPNIRPKEDKSRFRSRDGGNTDHISKDFSNGGTALIQIIPPLNSKLFIIINETFPASLSSSAFFLPSLINSQEHPVWSATKSPAGPTLYVGCNCGLCLSRGQPY